MDSNKMWSLPRKKSSSYYLGYCTNFDYVCGWWSNGAVHSAGPESKPLERAIHVKLYAFPCIGYLMQLVCLIFYSIRTCKQRVTTMIFLFGKKRQAKPSECKPYTPKNMSMMPSVSNPASPVKTSG